MMRPFGPALVATLLILVSCSSTEDERVSSGGRLVERPTTVGIDPRADELVRAMSDFVTSEQNFRFTSDDTVDSVIDSGERVQFAHHREVLVSRPDRLAVRTTGDERNVSLWKDGETVTILDRDANVYAQLDDPGTIDDMMDMLWLEYGVDVPLADLLSSDPYGVLMNGVQSGRYLGEHVVDDVPSHHMVFSRDDIDFQLWIRVEGNPVPTKLLITYKDIDGEPAYTTYIRGGERLEEVDDAAFVFVPPEGAEQVDMLPLVPADAEEG